MFGPNEIARFIKLISKYKNYKKIENESETVPVIVVEHHLWFTSYGL